MQALNCSLKEKNPPHTFISQFTRITNSFLEEDINGIPKSINSHSSAYNTTGMYLIKVIVQLALHEVLIVLARRDRGCRSRVKRGGSTTYKGH